MNHWLPVDLALELIGFAHCLDQGMRGYLDLRGSLLTGCWRTKIGRYEKKEIDCSVQQVSRVMHVIWMVVATSI